MENNTNFIVMKETISKILYSKAAFVWFCGLTTAIIAFLIYYAATEWSGYSLLDNIPIYCTLGVYFLEYRKYRKTGNASTVLMVAQLCCWIITAYNIAS